ncbi:MAG TPA: peptide deformylase [Candidatus Nanoarchaeia archaeon]|nr:peptide deformylase [Candidatus Nanoarchaeia archaeon]
MVTIVQKGADMLRQIAVEIPIADIQSKKIKNIIKEMHVGIASRADAVAIAAPQLGYSLRMFMVSKRVFITEEREIDADDVVYINPTIIKRSRKKNEADEGCLSVEQWYGKTVRSEKVTIRAYNEKGSLLERGASGLLAQVFQHEVDHLNGILFTDHATELVKLPKDKEKEEKIVDTNSKPKKK